MKYAAIIQYCGDAKLIAEQRPTHRAYLQSLLDRGSLLAAGPLEGDRGALIVYEAEDADDATALLRDDPFFRCGVFLSYELLPWRVVFGNRDLLPNGFAPPGS